MVFRGTIVTKVTFPHAGALWWSFKVDNIIVDSCLINSSLNCCWVYNNTLLKMPAFLKSQSSWELSVVKVRTSAAWLCMYVCLPFVLHTWGPRAGESQQKSWIHRKEGGSVGDWASTRKNDTTVILHLLGMSEVIVTGAGFHCGSGNCCRRQCGRLTWNGAGLFLFKFLSSSARESGWCYGCCYLLEKSTFLRTIFPRDGWFHWTGGGGDPISWRRETLTTSGISL